MVLADLHVDNIYLITGYTDMRKSVPGLVAIIVQQYQMRPDEKSALLTSRTTDGLPSEKPINQCFLRDSLRSNEIIPFFVPFAAGKSSAVTKAREFRECNHIEFKESNHIGLDTLPLQCYFFCEQGSGTGPLLICFEKDRILL